MFTTEIKFTINIHDDETLNALKALSPADGLIAVVKGVREIFKTSPQQIAYTDLRVSKQIAEALIGQDLVLVLPTREIRREIVVAAGTCTNPTALACEITRIFERRNTARPRLRRVLAIAEAMVKSGEAVLLPTREVAADKMLLGIIDGTAKVAHAAIRGRAFEDDVDACEKISEIVEAQTDAYPTTVNLRKCVARLAEMEIITITDSAMAS